MCRSSNHRRVNHDTTFVSKGDHHINGIENFWNQAKRHLRRFNEISKGSFTDFLKNASGGLTEGTILSCCISSNPGITPKSVELSYISS
jgi:hypothetical protein